MKFNKQINNGTLLIPGGAFKISGFEGGEKVEIHTLDSAVVVLKKQMTTMELIQAMDALHRLAHFLLEKETITGEEFMDLLHKSE